MFIVVYIPQHATLIQYQFHKIYPHHRQSYHLLHLD
jgi:hypothetical protein